MSSLNDCVKCEVGTIREIHQRLVAEGIHISQHALRTWVKVGRLGAIFSGKKAYLSYAEVLHLLRDTTGEHSA